MLLNRDQKEFSGARPRLMLLVVLMERPRLTTVVLDHVHTLSLGKAKYFRCHKQMDSYVKTRLELNDKAEIRISKNYKSIVIEAGGFEKLPFGEKDCRNHVDKARRL